MSTFKAASELFLDFGSMSVGKVSKDQRADKFFSRFCEKPLSLPQFMTMKLSIEPAGCYFTLSVLTVADFEKMALVSQNEA